MSRPVRWLAGDPALCAAVATELAAHAGGAVEVVHDNARRRILRLQRRDAPALLLKQYRTASGRHPLREWLKAWGGSSPARREWRNLRSLHDAGVPVPEPLALGVLDGGDRLLVTRWVAGASFAAGAGLPRRPRWELLGQAGRAVSAFHAAGFVHGDLHAGNLLVDGTKVTILDLQRARRGRSRRARHRDLGQLDYSLWPHLSRSDRMRLRHTALGVSGVPSAEVREELRAVGRAARRRANAHARSRTRRSLQPGRLYARVRIDELVGMRLREIEEMELAQAMKAHGEALASGGEATLKNDERSRISAVRVGQRQLVVKEFPARGILRMLADAMRGSPAQRAWLGGHGLRARGIGAAIPFAYLEQRPLGLPVASVVVMSDLRSHPDALEAVGRSAGEGLELLLRLLITLHRRDVDHGDLKATNVIAAPGEGACLVDLEGVRFPRRLSESRRLQALAQLNASIPDSCPATLRRRTFERYVRVHPFGAGSNAALEKVVQASLARRHRFRGTGCKLV